jgi:hypothetical protein
MIMQKKEKENRHRKITVRFTEKEFEKIEKSFKTTTKRKLSEYIRYVLLDRPVTVYTRDKSIDEMLVILASLKTELSAIGNNFNQAVKKLHTLDRIPDIKMWSESNEQTQKLFMQKTEEISSKIAQLADQWLHG